MKASEIIKIKADGKIFQKRSSATMRTDFDSQRSDWLLQPLGIERAFLAVPYVKPFVGNNRQNTNKSKEQII